MANRYELRSVQSKRMRNSFTCEESSDKLSDSVDENVDEGTETGAESYAKLAVDHHKKYGNIELVGAGPVAAGNVPDGRIFHLNYKAKNIDVPGAEVQTFFTEITKAKKDGVTIHRNISLGPNDSLSEKTNTQGCLYCLSHNINHHDSRIAFQNGGLLFWNTLRSEVCGLDNLMEKGMKKRNYRPKFKHPGIVYLGKEYDGTRMNLQVQLCACLILSRKQTLIL